MKKSISLIVTALISLTSIGQDYSKYEKLRDEKLVFDCGYDVSEGIKIPGSISFVEQTSTGKKVYFAGVAELNVTFTIIDIHVKDGKEQVYEVTKHQIPTDKVCWQLSNPFGCSSKVQEKTDAAGTPFVLFHLGGPGLAKISSFTHLNYFQESYGVRSTQGGNNYQSYIPCAFKSKEEILKFSEAVRKMQTN